MRQTHTHTHSHNSVSFKKIACNQIFKFDKIVRKNWICRNVKWRKLCKNVLHELANSGKFTFLAHRPFEISLSL